MREQLAAIGAGLEQVVTSLQAADLSGTAAVAALDLFERVARLAEAGRMMVLPRIDETRAWHGQGHPTVAHWTAARTGTTIGRAVDTLNTAKALTGLPDTRAALIAGAISLHQTHEIALAAGADPTFEHKLLSSAAEKTTSELRDECRMIRTAAAGDEHQEQIRRTRSLRSRLDADGAHLLTLRNTTDAVAPLLAYLHADADRRATQARRDGDHQPYEAHLADALCALPAHINAGEHADGAQRAKDRAVRAVVYIHADLTAWERGHTVSGERCHINGTGPTTIAAARRLAAEPGGLLKLAIHNDGNLTGVVSLGRYIPAPINDALNARDTKCIIKDCTRTRRLERDHRTPFAQGGETSITNLGSPCGYHHYLKTHKGWQIAGEPPNCEMIPPEGRDAGRPP